MRLPGLVAHRNAIKDKCSLDSQERREQSENLDMDGGIKLK